MIDAYTRKIHGIVCVIIPVVSRCDYKYTVIVYGFISTCKVYTNCVSGLELCEWTRAV